MAGFTNNAQGLWPFLCAMLRKEKVGRGKYQLIGNGKSIIDRCCFSSPICFHKSPSREIFWHFVARIS